MNQEFFKPDDLATIAPGLLLTILNTIPAGIQVLKAIRKDNIITDFEYSFINEGAKKNVGYTEKVGNKFLTATGDPELFKKMVAVIETGASLEFPLSNRVNGSIHSFNAKCVKLDDGILILQEDITEKKISELRSMEDAHFIGQIVDTTPDIIYIMDLNTLQLIYTNRQIAIELGYSREQVSLMKNPVIDIMYEDDFALVIEQLKKMKTINTDNTVIEMEYRLKDAKGGLHWFCDRSTVFKRNSREIPVEKISICQNISTRKEQEDRIRTSLNILHQSEEIAAMGSWEYDLVTGHFNWSEGMYKLFNLPKTTRPSPEIYFDHTPDEEKDIVTRMIKNITRDCKGFEEVISLIPFGQERKIVKIRSVAVKDKRKRLVKMIGVNLDITLQVKANEEITKLNETLTSKNQELEILNKELKTFNTVTAYDYRETLQSLYTNLEFIASKEARLLSDSSKANIRRAQSAIQKMKLLTEDINSYLQLYEIGVGKSLIDTNQVLADVVYGIRNKIEQVNATIEVAEIPPLPADPLLLSQLMVHLIDNAIKFRKLIASPVIKIKYSQADEMNTVAAARKNTAYAIISVSDNGIGFGEEDSERIFELFSRLHDKSKYKGSGIGLAICKRIMAMHEGFITAEGIPAAGASINCYFPLGKV